MIVLTHLDGPPFALNPDLIERIEACSDLGAGRAGEVRTVVTLVGGTRYVVEESLDDMLAKVRDFRGQVIAAANAYETTAGAKQERVADRGPTLRVVPRSGGRRRSGAGR